MRKGDVGVKGVLPGLAGLLPDSRASSSVRPKPRTT